jgi:tRNA(His) 5'-end guanylyltransferase
VWQNYEQAVRQSPPHLTMNSVLSQHCTGTVAGEQWISLRLDGTGFSKVVKSLRRNGVIEPEGFSADFANAMQACCRQLMDSFQATVGYTQCDADP